MRHFTIDILFSDGNQYKKYILWLYNQLVGAIETGTQCLLNRSLSPVRGEVNGPVLCHVCVAQYMATYASPYLSMLRRVRVVCMYVQFYQFFQHEALSHGRRKKKNEISKAPRRTTFFVVRPHSQSLASNFYVLAQSNSNKRLNDQM